MSMSMSRRVWVCAGACVRECGWVCVRGRGRSRRRGGWVCVGVGVRGWGGVWGGGGGGLLGAHL